MLYSLAIVLALAMVLCMIPAAFAASSEQITKNSYEIQAFSVAEDGSLTKIASDDDVNSLSIEYNYERLDKVVTGKYTEDRKMILVKVIGFDDQFADAKDIEVTIDGQDLEVNEGAVYDDRIRFEDDYVVFPVEATKSGYTDTYLVEVTGTLNKGQKDEKVLTESVKITLKLENTSEYKNAKTATISKIESTDRQVLDAYIVGSKIYLDFVDEYEAVEDAIEITFKDNNGDLFDVVTWAEEVESKDGKGAVNSVISIGEETKLSDSKTKYDVNVKAGDECKEIVFTLQTASAIYETKAYDVVVREDIKEADPKGIYFAESTKTIKIGEEYTPVVMGVATNKKVDADILPGKNTDKQVIDIDDGVVIGTQEGVAYITAEYTPAGGSTKYESNSMKITVTAGKVEDDDDDDTTDGKTYMVTASSLRVRSGAGTNFSQIGSLKNGATVKVESIANGWAKLENGGYVSAQYLAEVVDNGEAQTMYVTARTLNVRKGPGTSYAKVGTLSRGTAVQVVGFSGNWAKLSNGYYVSTSYLAK